MEKDFKTIIRENLEELRKKEGLSREQFSVKNGIDLTRYQNWMKKGSGAPTIPLGVLIKLAKNYKFDLNKFCGIKDGIKIQESRSHKNEFSEREAISYLDNKNRFIPLIILGMMGDYYERVIFNLYTDEDILKFLMKNRNHSKKIKKRTSILETLTSGLDEGQRNKFFGTLLKYTAQLLNIDNVVSPAEDFFFKQILRYNKNKKGVFALTELDEEGAKNILRSTKRDFNPFFHNKADEELKNCFLNPVIQKLTTWTLLIVALCDENISPVELQYIRQVSVHIGLDPVTLKAITDKVLRVINVKKAA